MTKKTFNPLTPPFDLTADSIADLTTKDHDLLTGLTDDDHTQYPLLAGLSGGQTLTGGTASGDDLTLASTSNATKGDIYLGTEATGKVIVGGTTFPSANTTATFGVNNNKTFSAAGTGYGNDFRCLPSFDTTTGGTWTGADLTSIVTTSVNMLKIMGVAFQAGPGGTTATTITDVIGVAAAASNTNTGPTVITATACQLQAGSLVGAITTAIGANVININFFGTTTNGIGYKVTSLPGSTSKIGVDIAALSGATTNIGIRVALATQYALQLSSTAGTAAGGITWGTDTNLYRSAANNLMTDDTLTIGGDLDHNGTNIGFFGVAPTTRQTELTDELTTITHTAPGTPDYAVQNLTNVAPYGFVSQDEGNTVLSVIANLQTRVNELETKLTAYGLLIDAD